MSDFEIAYPDIIGLDPMKRVKYSTGLVLGADEFRQEELYLLEKYRFGKRALHGYGTVCGLNVSIRDTASLGPEVLVSAGAAVNPEGQEIRVSSDQCALLNDWLKRNASKIQEETGSPPASSPLGGVILYLVLCYKECETDRVPIPSGPCQSLEETSVPSRIADDFRLRFLTEPPNQAEEYLVRDLVEMLRGIEISDAPGGLTREQIEGMVRTLGEETVSSPVDSPPVPSHMHPGDADKLIHAAFLVWVTEVRPRITNPAGSCAGSGEECVLLARFEFQVKKTGTGFIVDGNAEDVLIDEAARPYLLHTRLLQEYLRQCCMQTALKGIDESDIMHLSGDEIAPGQKTFAAPVMLIDRGRVRKRYTLIPGEATRINPLAVRPQIFRTIPAMRFVTIGRRAFSGELLFNLHIPDDIDYSVPVRLILHWGFLFSGTLTGNLTFTWGISNRYLSPDEEVPTSITGFSSLDFSGSIARAQRGRLLTTEPITLPDSLGRADRFGVLRVRVNAANPASAQIFLIQSELNYIANRLGRSIR